MKKALNRIFTAAGLATLVTLPAHAELWQEGYNYKGGEVVQSQDSEYQCKPFPYSGWCGLSAYEPGVGFAWADAWEVKTVATPTLIPTVKPTELCAISIPAIASVTLKASTSERNFYRYDQFIDRTFDSITISASGAIEQTAEGVWVNGRVTELNVRTYGDQASNCNPPPKGLNGSGTIYIDYSGVVQATGVAYPEFIPGLTKPSSGELYSYQGSCFKAKNNPGTWETPREGWFWNKVDCVAPTSVVTSPVITNPPVSPTPPMPSSTVLPCLSPTIIPTTGVFVPEITFLPTVYYKAGMNSAKQYDLAQLMDTNGQSWNYEFIDKAGNVSVEQTGSRVMLIGDEGASANFELSETIYWPPGSCYGQDRHAYTLQLVVGHEYAPLLLGTTPVPSVTPSPIAKTPVIAYQPSWAFNLNAIQWDKLTHINYSFALPDADGSLIIEAPQNLQALSNAAVGKDTEIWLAIGGWTIGDGGGNDADWSTIVSNRQLLDRFKGEIKTAIDTYNLDGIDIDWEWPNNTAEQALFLQLMQELDAMLTPQNKGLSTAVISYGANGQYVDSAVFELVDFLNIMAYDGNWPWSGDNKHSDMQVALDSLAYWADQRGVANEKVILGVPFYCRGNNQSLSYEQLLAMGADPAGDAYQGCYYNGTATMKAKAELAKQSAGGVMFWELSQDVEDNRSLLTVIDSVLNP